MNRWWLKRPREVLPELGWILSVWLLTRGLLTLVGVLAVSVLGVQTIFQVSNFDYHTHTVLPLEVWVRWDAEWYLNIADHGYTWQRFGDLGQLNWAWMPLYPFLIACARVLFINDIVSGLVVSNGMLLVASVLLYRLTRLHADEAAARRSVLYLMVFPTSFFLSSIFSEATYLALVLGTFYLARKDRWLAAGLCGFLAGLTRLQGTSMAMVLLAEAWLQRRELRSRLPAVVGSLLPVLAVPALMGIQKYMLGDPLAYFHGMKFDYALNAVSLGEPLLRFIHGPRNVVSFYNSWHDVVALLYMVAATGYGFYRRLRPSYLIFMLLTVVALLTVSASYTRYACVDFPCYFLLADLGANQERHNAIVITSAVLASFFMTLFSIYRWVG